MYFPKVLDVTTDKYYREPAAQFARLYAVAIAREPMNRKDSDGTGQ